MVHRNLSKAPGLLCVIGELVAMPNATALCLIPWCGKVAWNSILWVQGTVVGVT